MSSSYKYDVSFSFTQEDENLATQLYRLLKDRLSCFIYTEEQKSLAGRDGESVFNRVFSKESRIVVILFRNNYGKTKWTRIEETAIKNRGFDEGYDFVILIPLGKPVQPPSWIPKNRLWVGLERWGIESAASVIEAKTQEFGGVVKVESIADIVARKENEIKQKKIREQTLNGSAGLDLTLTEVTYLKELMQLQVTDIKNKTPEWNIRVRQNKRNGLDIITYGYTLYFHFYQQYQNSLTDAFLYFSIYAGYLDDYGQPTDPFQENSVVDNLKLCFDINEFDEKGWSLKDSGTKFKTSQQLIDEWVLKVVSLSTTKRLKDGY